MVYTHKTKPDVHQWCILGFILGSYKSVSVLQEDGYKLGKTTRWPGRRTMAIVWRRVRQRTEKTQLHRRRTTTASDRQPCIARIRYK